MTLGADILCRDMRIEFGVTVSGIWHLIRDGIRRVGAGPAGIRVAHSDDIRSCRERALIRVGIAP